MLNKRKNESPDKKKIKKICGYKCTCDDKKDFSTTQVLFGHIIQKHFNGVIKSFNDFKHWITPPLPVYSNKCACGFSFQAPRGLTRHLTDNTKKENMKILHEAI